MKKNNLVKSFIIIVLALISFLAIGCGEKTPEFTLSCETKNVELTEGETIKVDAVLTEGFTIEWTSLNEDIATVSNGTITAIKAGNATIKISVKDQNSGAIEISVVVKEKIIDLDYFKNHLDTTDFTSYVYKSIILSEEIEVQKIETVVTFVNSKYEIKTTTTNLGTIDDTTPYVETVEEETVDSIDNPVSLVLDAACFTEMVFAKYLFEAKVLDAKALDFLGIEDITDITLSIELNNDLKIEEIIINYTDVDTSFKVELSVVFSY